MKIVEQVKYKVSPVSYSGLYGRRTSSVLGLSSVRVMEFHSNRAYDTIAPGHCTESTLSLS